MVKVTLTYGYNVCTVSFYFSLLVSMAMFIEEGLVFSMAGAGPLVSRDRDN